MRTVSISRKGKEQVVLLPPDMAYEGIRELEIRKSGDVITLRPVRPTWESLSGLPVTDCDFIQERSPVVNDEGRFDFAVILPNSCPGESV